MNHYVTSRRLGGTSVVCSLKNLKDCFSNSHSRDQLVQVPSLTNRLLVNSQGDNWSYHEQIN